MTNTQLMKKYQNFGILASVVFAVGMLGLNISDGTIALDQADSPALVSAAGISGHLEAIVTDSEGNIKSYQQTDNGITNNGVNCTMVMLFGAATDADHCRGAQTSGAWKVIGLEDSLLATGLDFNSNSTLNTVTGNGMDPATGTATITTAGTGATGGTAGVVRIANTFACSGACGTITGATLLNGTDANTNGMFAYKDFSSSVALVSGDSLTVNWDLTITGGGVETEP